MLVGEGIGLKARNVERYRCKVLILSSPHFIQLIQQLIVIDIHIIIDRHSMTLVAFTWHSEGVGCGMHDFKRREMGL
jgi:hypothetical protein